MNGIFRKLTGRWNFCKFLINAVGVNALPKQRVGYHFENFE